MISHVTRPNHGLPHHSIKADVQIVSIGQSACRLGVRAVRPGWVWTTHTAERSWSTGSRRARNIGLRGIRRQRRVLLINLNNTADVCAHWTEQARPQRVALLTVTWPCDGFDHHTRWYKRAGCQQEKLACFIVLAY